MLLQAVDGVVKHQLSQAGVHVVRLSEPEPVGSTKIGYFVRIDREKEIFVTYLSIRQ